jgi:hypothetical protein
MYHQSGKKLQVNQSQCQQEAMFLRLKLAGIREYHASPEDEEEAYLYESSEDSEDTADDEWELDDSG